MTEPGGSAAGAAAAAPRHGGLTRLRLLLIMWVILYHLDLPLRVSVDLPVLRPLLGVGYLGVDGFFLLSGFALYLGYGDRPPAGLLGTAQFLLRRVAKIWPLHAMAMLALAALVGLAVLTGHEIRNPERFGFREFVLQFFLVNAWETTTRHAWNYPSWALSAEWAGYLAFPFAIGAIRRLSPRLLPVVPALALVGLALLEASQTGVGLNYTLHLGLLRFALEFLLGLSLGRLARAGRLPQAALLAGSAAGLVAGLLGGIDTLVVAGLALAIPAVWQHPARPPAAGQASPGLWERLGEASFGVYLCWVFVEAALVLVLRQGEFGTGERLLLMGGALVVNLAAGWLAWRLVEVPAHRWVLRHNPLPPLRRVPA